MTMPRPLTYTRTFAVPRSTPIRLPNITLCQPERRPRCLALQRTFAKSALSAGEGASGGVGEWTASERRSFLGSLRVLVSSYPLDLRPQRAQLLVDLLVAPVHMIDVR